MAGWRSIIGALLSAVVALLIATFTPQEMASFRITLFLLAGALVFLALCFAVMENAYFKVRRDNRALAAEWRALSDEMYAELQSFPATKTPRYWSKKNLSEEEKARAFHEEADEITARYHEFRGRVERRFNHRVETARREMAARALLSTSDASHLSHWSTNPLTVAEAAKIIGAHGIAFGKANGG